MYRAAVGVKRKRVRFSWRRNGRYTLSRRNVKKKKNTTTRKRATYRYLRKMRSVIANIPLFFPFLHRSHRVLRTNKSTHNPALSPFPPAVHYLPFCNAACPIDVYWPCMGPRFTCVVLGFGFALDRRRSNSEDESRLHPVLEAKSVKFFNCVLIYILYIHIYICMYYICIYKYTYKRV